MNDSELRISLLQHGLDHKVGNKVMNSRRVEFHAWDRLGLPPRPTHVLRHALPFGARLSRLVVQ